MPDVRRDDVVLRRPQPGDLEALHEIHADPAVWTLSPDHRHATRADSERMLAELLEHWDRHGFGYWAVEAGGEVVGFAGVRWHDLDGEQVLNAYFRFRPRAQGRGYATYVLRRALELACTRLPGTAVVVRTRPGNDAAVRVAEKAGLVDAGVEDDAGGPMRLLRWNPTAPAEAVRSAAPSSRSTADAGPARGTVVDAVVPDAALRAELLALWVEVVNAGGAVGFVGAVTAADVAPMLDRELGTVTAGAAELVVLRVDGELAGFCLLRRNTFPIMAHWAWVGRVMVDPRRRGEGLGLALMEGVHRVARAEGLEALRLTVRGGLGLEGFYLRAGYVEVGRVPRGLRVGTPDQSDDRDDVMMWREL